MEERWYSLPSAFNDTLKGQTWYRPCWHKLDVTSPDADRTTQLEQYGLIGNMRTAALIATDGALDMLCWPHFDSPSIFARILDKHKGGHFTISPSKTHKGATTKQQYLPSNNILQTRYLGEEGVLNLLDFFPRPARSADLEVVHELGAKISRRVEDPRNVLKKWLVRRVECIRGECDVEVEVLPAFNYARDEHTVEVVDVKDQKTRHGECGQTVQFKSKDLSLQLNATVDCGDYDGDSCPKLVWQKSKGAGLGEGVRATVKLMEGQGISFVLRDLEDEQEEHITSSVIETVQKDTSKFWYNWIGKSKYKGRWREVVNRSLMILKMLVFEPTGAIVAAPTFSLPEDFGGGRNWDYRFSWVCDVALTLRCCRRLTLSRFATRHSPSIFFSAWATARKPKHTCPLSATE